MNNFACPYCAMGLTAPSQTVGQSIGCPSCRGTFLVPGNVANPHQLHATAQVPQGAIECPQCRGLMRSEPSLAGQIVSCSFCEFPFQMAYQSPALPAPPTSNFIVDTPIAQPQSLDFEPDDSPEPKRKYGKKTSAVRMGSFGKIVLICVIMVCAGLLIFAFKGTLFGKNNVEETRYPSGKIKTRREQIGDKKILTTWDEDGGRGELTTVGRRVVLLRTWSASGSKTSELTLSSTSASGEHRKWFPNGKPRGHIRFVSGFPNGECTGHYESGQKFFEMQWGQDIYELGKSSSLDGPMRIWYRDGKQMAVINWRYGTAVSEEYWSSDGTPYGGDLSKATIEVQKNIDSITRKKNGHMSSRWLDELGWPTPEFPDEK